MSTQVVGRQVVGGQALNGRGTTDSIGGDKPVVKRGREDAIAFARALMARGIHVVRLRRSKAAAPQTRPALTAEPRR